MKVPIKTILAFAACGLFAGGAASLSASAEEAPGAELFLPTSYEQYLALEDPTCVAMSDACLAIADGSTLYLYDRATGVYSSYSHTGNTADEGKILQLQFTLDGRLFYSDDAAHLYRYDFETGTANRQTDVSCATFLIDGETLYTASVTNLGTSLYEIPCGEKEDVTFDDAKPRIGTTDDTKTPCLFLMDGTLYCVAEKAYLAYTPAEGRLVKGAHEGGRLVQGLSSVAVLGSKIYYSLNSQDASYRENNGIYAADPGAEGELLVKEDGVESLSVYDGKLYSVQGSSVRELAEEDGKLVYTGYEIASSSPSPNRLNGATDIVRAKDLIVTADVGNGRTTVYNMAENTYSLLATGAPSLVATDGETVAAAVEENGAYAVKVYAPRTEGGYPEEPTHIHPLDKPALGLVCLFGRTYYVTSHAFGVAEEGAEELIRDRFSPAALAVDLFGNLYVAEARRTVTKFTEEEFLDPAAAGTPVGVTLPEGFTSFRSDFEGNLYCLIGTTVWRLGAEGADEALGSFDGENAVCYGGEVPSPAAFALGFEDSTIYLQYGNFALKASTDIPTLSTVDAGGAYGSVSAKPTQAAAAYTSVRKGAVGVRIDFGALREESEYFSCLSYARRDGGGTGIKLAEKPGSGFTLVAFYEDHTYSPVLFRTEDCTDLPAELTPFDGLPRYTTNEIALTRFPCLFEELTTERIPRASEVALCATLSMGGTGVDYAFVRYGETYGYVPLSYLAEGSPVLPDPDSFTIGYLKANPDGIVLHAEEEGKDDLVLYESTQVKIYDLGNGLYRVACEENGVVYTAQVTPHMIRTGNSDILRISLIIVLCVLAITIIAAYAALLPRKRKYTGKVK